VTPGASEGSVGVAANGMRRRRHVRRRRPRAVGGRSGADQWACGVALEGRTPVPGVDVAMQGRRHQAPCGQREEQGDRWSGSGHHPGRDQFQNQDEAEQAGPARLRHPEGREREESTAPDPMRQPYVEQQPRHHTGPGIGQVAGEVGEEGSDQPPAG